MRLYALLLVLLLGIVGCATDGTNEVPAPKAARVPIADTWTWDPAASATGPVTIDVSLSQQKMWVYRNGVEIGSSPISSGKGTKPTPPGSYSILEKKPMHRSNLYGTFVNANGQAVAHGKRGQGPAGTSFVGAPMPHMQRLTWDGVCMHQGDLPGYPASSGCIRLPEAFAQRLYTVTSVGTPVYVR